MIEKYTEADLFDKLTRQYKAVMSTAVVPHASIGAESWTRDFKHFEKLGGETSVRRIDALILFREKRWAVEIKVSLQDLKQELANPAKQELWAAHTHSFYFFVAPHLLDYAKEHVPKQYGIMVADFQRPYQSYKGETHYYTETCYIARRAKKNLTPEEIPYATVRRMGVSYAKALREIQDLKTTVADLQKAQEPSLPKRQSPFRPLG